MVDKKSLVAPSYALSVESFGQPFARAALATRRRESGKRNALSMSTFSRRVVERLLRFGFKHERQTTANGSPALSRARPSRRPLVMTSPVCTFEARLGPGCVCAVALRRAADGTGGGVLFPSVSPGLNAFGCAPETKLPLSDVSGTEGARGNAATTTEMRLEDLALCLECVSESGCVPSRPVDLARALDASSPGDGSPASSRLHLGALVASRRPPRARPETKATLTTRRAGWSRTPVDAPLSPSPSRSAGVDANGHREAEKEPGTKTKTKTRLKLKRLACASAAKAAVSIAAALAFLAAAPR